jgi:hypothetical protein
MTLHASPPSWRAALESAVLAVGTPALGWLLDRQDAFFLGHRFSWLAFVPLLVGLRHGFVLGCASALLLDSCLVFSWRTHALGVDAFPGETLVALVAVAMLAGQFCDAWRRESRRLGAQGDSLGRRLDEISRAHALLELSHDRLERQTDGAPNLRHALAAVRALAADAGGDFEPLAPTILEIFATYAMVEVASIYRVTSGEAEDKAVAVLGRPRPVSPHDPLVREAVKTRRLTYVPTVTQSERGPASNLLVAAALPDASGRARAVLCVESLPFMAFHHQNLEIIATLAGHVADLLWGPALGREREAPLEHGVRPALAERHGSDVPVALAGEGPAR